MHTISGISASTASRMASAAAGGGTYSTVAVAPVAAFASATVANTGRSRCFSPAFLGLTPPTIWVPYSMACWQWKVPVLPVKPWQITFVSLNTAGGGGFDASPLLITRRNAPRIDAEKRGPLI